MIPKRRLEEGGEPPNPSAAVCDIIYSGGTLDLISKAEEVHSIGLMRRRSVIETHYKLPPPPKSYWHYLWLRLGRHSERKKETHNRITRYLKYLPRFVPGDYDPMVFPKHSSEYGIKASAIIDRKYRMDSESFSNLTKLASETPCGIVETLHAGQGYQLRGP